MAHTVAAVRAYRHAPLSSIRGEPRWWAKSGRSCHLALGELFAIENCFSGGSEALEPDNTAQHVTSLGIVLRANSDLSGSIQVLKKALVVDPDHPEA
jgi:hypothetical protein